MVVINENKHLPCHTSFQRSLKFGSSVGMRSGYRPHLARAGAGAAPGSENTGHSRRCLGDHSVLGTRDLSGAKHVLSPLSHLSSSSFIKWHFCLYSIKKAEPFFFTLPRKHSLIKTTMGCLPDYFMEIMAFAVMTHISSYNKPQVL